mgnify:CR=1 FL=1
MDVLDVDGSDKEDDDISDDVLDKVNSKFLKKVSPDLLNRISAEFRGDPLKVCADKCDNLAKGLDIMLEASLLFSDHMREVESEGVKERFRKSIVQLREMIREDNQRGAELKLGDIYSLFNNFRRSSLSIYGRLTQLIQDFPGYSAELSDIADNIRDVRTGLIEDKVLLMGDEDFEKLAIELYKVVMRVANGGSIDDSGSSNKTVQAFIENKRTVMDSLKPKGE